MVTAHALGRKASRALWLPVYPRVSMVASVPTGLYDYRERSRMEVRELYGLHGDTLGRKASRALWLPACPRISMVTGGALGLVLQSLWLHGLSRASSSRVCGSMGRSRPSLSVVMVMQTVQGLFPTSLWCHVTLWALPPQSLLLHGLSGASSPPLYGYRGRSRPSLLSFYGYMASPGASSPPLYGFPGCSRPSPSDSTVTRPLWTPFPPPTPRISMVSWDALCPRLPVSVVMQTLQRLLPASLWSHGAL